jgi:transposase InsO family protein
LQQQLGVSERRACRTIGQPRSTQRKPQVVPDDEAVLSAAIVKLAGEYGRYGYRRITELLRAAGWRVNAKRVQRIWRREGLKVPSKQPNADGCGSTMVRACGCGHSIPITCGPRISSPTGPTMGDQLEC